MSDDTTCYRLGVYQRTEGTLTRHTLSFLCTYNSILFLVTGLSSGKRCHPHKGVLVPRFPHRPRLQENAQPYLRFLNSSDPSTSVTCSELAHAQKNTCLQGSTRCVLKRRLRVRGQTNESDWSASVSTAWGAFSETSINGALSAQELITSRGQNRLAAKPHLLRRVLF